MDNFIARQGFKIYFEQNCLASIQYLDVKREDFLFLH
jgi:hypothetical protein